MKKLKKINLVIAILLTALSVFLFYLGAVFKIERTLTYSEEGNVDYKVYLKSNSYYDTPYLGKNRKYIASLIDHIDVTYDYHFKTDKNMQYKCNYHVSALTLVKDSGNDGKVIYDKEKYLVNDKSKTVSGKEFDISETLSLDYNEYNSIVEAFNTKYALSGNTNMLKLSLVLDLAAQSSEFDTPIKDKSTMDLNIPLTDRTVAIDLEYKEIDSSGKKSEVSSNTAINTLFFVLASVCGVLAVAMILIIVRRYLIVKKQETYYEREKSAILSRFGRIISNVDEIKNVSEDEFINVDTFEDLVNIRDCLERPILFREVFQGGEEISWFVVVDNEDRAYRYVLKDREEEK